MNPRKALATNLVRLRERAGLSQNALAKRCRDVSQSTISRIEAMEVAADLDTLTSLASGLRVSVWQLLSEDLSPVMPLSVQEEQVIYQIRNMAGTKS